MDTHGEQPTVNDDETQGKGPDKAHLSLESLFVVIPLLRKHIAQLKIDIEALDDEDDELPYVLQELDDCLDAENELREAYEQESRSVINYPSYSDLVQRHS